VTGCCWSMGAFCGSGSMFKQFHGILKIAMTGTVAGRCNVQGRDEGENVLTESPEFLSLETCFFFSMYIN
jgi:hypothetical protein